MPPRFRAFYQENKKPSRDFFSYWGLGGIPPRPLLSAFAFFAGVGGRISQSEIRNSAAAESEGGQKFLPPNPV